VRSSKMTVDAASVRPLPPADRLLDRLLPAVKLLTSKTTLRLVLVLTMGVLAVTLGGCARTTLTGVTQDQLSAGTEPYFNVGGVTYQVQISRQLNPFGSEDVQYLAGVQGAQSLPADQLWFGVFLWAKNQTKQIRNTSDTFEIVDSEGDVYHPEALNASVNPYAWTSQALSQNQIEPLADSTASSGSTGGGLILIKLNDSVYSNRPLTLEIFKPGDSTPSKVSLDL
jgi:hypothetical protein